MSASCRRANQLRRLDVDRILVAERPALHTEDEPELLDVAWQVGKGEMGFLAFVAVEQLERLEIAEQLVPRAVPLWERIEVRAGLDAGGRLGRGRRSSAPPVGRPARTGR